jgi:hypothetical protein
MGSLELPTTPPAPATLLLGDQDPLPPSVELKPRFRLSTLLIGVTSSAICLGVARSIPELAIALVFIMAIAMIRVLYGIQLYVDSGARLTFPGELCLYLLSILAVISIGGFVVLAFAVTLGAGTGLGMLIAMNADARETEWIFGGFIAGWILGLVAACLTGGWLTKAIWFVNLGPKACIRHL